MEQKLRHWPKAPKSKYVPGLLRTQLDKSKLRQASQVKVILAPSAGIQYHAFEIAIDHNSLHSKQKARNLNSVFTPVDGAL